MKKQNLKKNPSLSLPPSTCQMKVKKNINLHPPPPQQLKKKEKKSRCTLSPVAPFPRPIMNL
jgi:hypothetical protein